MRSLRVVTASLVAMGASSTLAWQHLVAGTPDPGRVASIATMADRDVVAGGRFGTAAAGDDGLVVRLEAADGAEVWRRLVVGTGAGADTIREVSVLSGGDVVGAGQVTNITSGADAVVVRLAGTTGVEPWRTSIDGGSNGADDIRTMARLGDDLIAVGASTRPDLLGPFTIWRLDADDGSITWDTHITGAESAGRVVAVEGSTVYVAGHVAHDPAGTDIVVARLNGGTGEEEWKVTIADSGNEGDVVQAIAVPDPDHVVIAIDLMSPTTGPDVVVIGLNAADGTEMWRVPLDGDQTGVDQDRAWGLAVDGGGNVVLACTLDNPSSGEDIVAVKLAGATGTEAWRTTFDGPSSRSDEARSVAIDASGNVIVVGRSRSDTQDGLTWKLDGTSGDELWRSLLIGVVAGGDLAIDVAIDADDHVAIGGFTTNGDAADEMTVARLSSGSGGSFPCGNGATDGDEACDDGNPTAGDGCRVDCTIEICGDGILDPGEACDGGAGISTDCCSDTCALEADGMSCEDADVCTSGGTCTAGLCTTSTPLCHDADPCTVDTCTAGGCTNTAIAGVRSASCVFDRTTIATECPGDLPRPIAKALTRAETQLDAAAASVGKKIRTLLKKARSSAKKTRKLATKAGRKGSLAPACAETLTTEMEDLVGRLQALLAS